MNEPSKNIIAVIVATAPAFLLAVAIRSLSETTMGIFEMLTYPLLFGGGTIVLILLLNKYLVGSTVRSFNRLEGALWVDIPAGLLLTLIFILLAVIHQATIARWLPSEPPTEEIQSLIVGLSENPILMLIWLGPVVWIGVALFEELHRAFFLKCLWNVWDGLGARWGVLILSAVLSGAIHYYQGITGAISTGTLGFFSGWYYLRYGRILPLVIAHALYDSAWIIFGISMVRSG